MASRRDFGLELAASKCFQRWQRIGSSQQNNCIEFFPSLRGLYASPGIMVRFPT
jgi:hypothetical protein